MAARLEVSIGQCSDKGRKAVNQDFHGAYVPEEPQRSAKGVAVALADGISSSDVGHIASEMAVRGFLADYYCTSEAWSVKKSAQRVLTAINAWLYAQTRRSQYRDDANRGYVCTVSALVMKSVTAHLFHVGDGRIYLLRGGRLQQLTEDHRVWIARNQSYLGRALGIDHHVEIDYLTIALDPGDVFIIVTDGVYEYVDSAFMADTLSRCRDDLDAAARTIVNEALARGSADNLTIQIVGVDGLPEKAVTELYQQFSELPFPPALNPRTVLDGYEIRRSIHTSSRSHVYLARDLDTERSVAIKTPATELREDPVLLERFLMEEWVGRRINNPHVAKPVLGERKRSYLYVAMEYIEGQSLTQWMTDNPKPDLEKVRAIVEQLARGIRAFHRQEMVHQDLRPGNVLIDTTGTVKIIDFGATQVAGISDLGNADGQDDILGTEQYAAPEYFLGEPGTPRSDLFSLAAITYQMLTGSLPYGTQVPNARTRAAQNRLKYKPVRAYNPDILPWVDGALRKALHPDPSKRYAEVSEFVHDLRHPNRAFIGKARPPLMERDPERFWKGVSFVLAFAIAALVVARQVL